MNDIFLLILKRSTEKGFHLFRTICFDFSFRLIPYYYAFYFSSFSVNNAESRDLYVLELHPPWYDSVGLYIESLFGKLKLLYLVLISYFLIQGVGGYVTLAIILKKIKSIYQVIFKCYCSVDSFPLHVISIRSFGVFFFDLNGRRSSAIFVAFAHNSESVHYIL